MTQTVGAKGPRAKAGLRGRRREILRPSLNMARWLCSPIPLEFVLEASRKKFRFRQLRLRQSKRSPKFEKWTPAKRVLRASGAPTRREARLKTAPALRAAVQNLARPLRSRPFNTGVVRSTERLPCIALASSSPTPGIHSPANASFTVRHTNLPAAYCSVVDRSTHCPPLLVRAVASVRRLEY